METYHIYELKNGEHTLSFYEPVLNADTVELVNISHENQLIHYHIGQNCFYNNQDIITLHLPFGCLGILNHAFEKSKIVNLYLYTLPPQIKRDAFVDSSIKKIYVPAGAKRFYDNDAAWKRALEEKPDINLQEGNYNIPYTDKYLKSLYLVNETKLEKVQIGDGIEDVGYMALFKTGIDKPNYELSIGEDGAIETGNHNSVFYNINDETKALVSSHGKTLINEEKYVKIVYWPNSHSGVCSGDFNLSEKAQELKPLSFANNTLDTLVLSNKNVKIEPHAFYNTSVSTFSLNNIELLDNANLVGISYSTTQKTGNRLLVSKDNTQLLGKARYAPDKDRFWNWNEIINNHNLQFKFIPQEFFKGQPFQSNTVITIPNWIKHIGKGAFQDIKNITSIIVNEREDDLIIDDQAFLGCSISELILPGDHVIMGKEVIDCAQELKITIGINKTGTINKILNTTFKNGKDKISRILILDKSEIMESYKEAEGWKDLHNKIFGLQKKGTLIIPSGIKIITEEMGFSGNPYIMQVQIPTSVEKINFQAFKDCGSLWKITFYNEDMDSVEGNNIPTLIIDNRAFVNCTGIYEFTLPKRLRGVGYQAFMGCDKLLKVNDLTLKGKDTWDPEGSKTYLYANIKEGVELEETELGDISQVYYKIDDNTRCLVHCLNSTELTEMRLPKDSYQYKLHAAFLKNNNLIQKITIPNNVIDIGYEAFANMGNLQEINLGLALASSINGDNQIFYGSGYNSPKGIKLNTIAPAKIPAKLFSGCEHLRTVNMYEGAEKDNGNVIIGRYAFANCSGLRQVIMAKGKPLSDTSSGWLGEGCFENCKGLYDIAIWNEDDNNNKEAIKKYINTINPNKSGLFQYAKNIWWKEDIGSRTEYVNNDFEFYYDDASKLQYLIGYKGMGTKIDFAKVPMEYEGYIDIGIFKNKNIELINLLGSQFIGLNQEAFSGSRLQKLTLSSNIKTMGEKCFYNCSHLQSADLSKATKLNEKSTSETQRNNLTGSVIPHHAFQNCSALEQLILPSDTVQIDDNAFQGCTKLRVINIPSTVKRIEGYALSFGGQWTNPDYGSPSNPIVITFNSTTPPAIANTAFQYTNYLKIRVPAGSLNSYQTSTNWVNLMGRVQIETITDDLDQLYLGKAQTVQWEEYVP